MDWIEILQQIFELCILPLLGLLTSVAIEAIRKKSKSISDATDNALAKKYLAMLTDTITSCVYATNQTYVDALKNKNAFTKEAQEEAFNKTYQSVMQILSTDAKQYLESFSGDLDNFIKTSIEAEVRRLK